jgi:hypothetical protein
VKRLAFAFTFVFVEGDEIEAPAGADAGLNKLPFTTGLGNADPEPPPKKSLGAPGLLVPRSNELDNVEDEDEDDADPPIDAPVLNGTGAAALLNKEPLKAGDGVVGGFAGAAPIPGDGQVPEAPVALSNARFLSAEVDSAPPPRLSGNG